jgi:hypothetical protein
VLGRPVDKKWDELDWRAAFKQLRETIAPDLERIGLGDLHAQDLQNCLCEFDKFMREKNGEGHPKRRFAPSQEPLAEKPVSPSNPPKPISPDPPKPNSSPSPSAVRALAAALEAAKQWPIFPCDPSTKQPKIKGGFYSATKDRKQIMAWWKTWPNAMIGVPTGEGTGFWVLDLDVKNDKRGIETWEALQAQHGGPVTTRTHTTASGGRHLLFRYDIARPVGCSTERLGNGVDTRGYGGYVIVPPSRNAHGGEYRADDPFLPIEDAPAWLYDLIGGALPKGGEPGGEPEADPAMVATALAVIPNEDLGWDDWNVVGMATWRATKAAPEGLTAFDAFSRKSKKYSKERTAERWGHYADSPPNRVGAGTIFYMANQADPDWRKRHDLPQRVSLDDFYAYMPKHHYIYVPSREPWPGTSVNARIQPVPILDASGQPVLDDHGKPMKIKASTWLDQNRPIEQMTWAPGKPALIANRLVLEGGWIDKAGVTTFNLYHPPILEPGDPAQAQRWVDHVRKLFGDDADHIIKWFAQRVQQPGVKINHALVLGSYHQGIGKDTLLEPVKRAIGAWNFTEVTAQQLMGRFTGFFKSVILRVSEVRDLGESNSNRGNNRYQFYDHMKPITAAPPDVLRVDEKNIREHNIMNCVGVIYTTNYKTTGIYIPAGDRRHFVAWSNCAPADLPEGYFEGLWDWYNDGGYWHVAAYLAQLDISDFDPNEPPPKTNAFWEIVNANRSPEDAELADVIEKLGTPRAITIRQVVDGAFEQHNADFADWLKDRRNHRRIPHRFEQCDYIPLQNPDATDGLWKIGTRKVVYVQKSLSVSEQLDAAMKLVRSVRKPADDQKKFDTF